MLAKILGSFMLVGGIILAVPLLIAIVAGAFALFWVVLKVACVAVLIYFGWRWLSSQH
jgi:threonine/homoserine/homoserine lactone efflux protein